MSEPVLIDPTDEILVTFQWADYLGPGMTISSVSYTVPAPLATFGEAMNMSEATSQVGLRNAVHGVTYHVRARATLSNGEFVNNTIAVRGHRGI